MLNAIILGLNALSAITGFVSGTIYETQPSDLNNIATFICEKNNISYQSCDELNCIEYISDLYALSGENRYLEVNLEKGYLIYDKKEMEIKEYSFTNDSPYEKYENNFKVYSTENFGFKYVTYHNASFVDSLTSNNIDFTKMTNCDRTSKWPYYELFVVFFEVSPLG